MQFTHEMILQSDSGYCMPFEEKNKDVEMSLGYGKQKQLLQVRCRDWEMMPFTASIRSSATATMK